MMQEFHMCSIPCSFSVIVSFLGFNYTTSVVLHLQVLIRASNAYFRSKANIMPIQIWNGKRDRFLFNLILLHHIYVGYTNMCSCERLCFNLFCCTFVHFTIVVLTWYKFTSYSIVLPMSFSVLFIRTWSICLGVLFYVTT